MAGELISMVIVPMAKQGAHVIAANAPRIASGAAKIAAGAVATAIAKEEMNKVLTPLAKSIIK